MFLHIGIITALCKHSWAHNLCRIMISGPRSLTDSQYLKTAEENSKTYPYNYLSHVQ